MITSDICNSRLIFSWKTGAVFLGDGDKITAINIYKETDLPKGGP